MFVKVGKKLIWREAPSIYEMNLAKQRHDSELKKINQRYMRAMYVNYIISCCAFVACLFFEENLKFIAEFIRNYMPSIDKLMNSKNETRAFSGIYFSVCTLLMPLLLFLQCRRQNFVFRYKYSLDFTSSKSKWLAVILSTALVIAIILYAIVVSPGEEINNPNSRSGLIGHAMFESKAGLFIVGNLFVVVIVAFLSLLMMIATLPISFYKNLRKEIS